MQGGSWFGCRGPNCCRPDFAYIVQQSHTSIGAWGLGPVLVTLLPHPISTKCRSGVDWQNCWLLILCVESSITFPPHDWHKNCSRKMIMLSGTLPTLYSLIDLYWCLLFFVIISRTHVVWKVNSVSLNVEYLARLRGPERFGGFFYG